MKECKSNVFQVNPEWLLKNPVTSGIQDSKGDFWFVSSQDGIFRIHNDKIQNITEDNGLPMSALLSIFQDRENDFWIGTNLKGILKLASLRFSHFSKNEGFGDEAVIAVLNSESKKYCGTERGIYLFIEPEFKKINLFRSNNLPFNHSVLKIVKYKNYFLLGCSTGLYEFKGFN